MRHVLAAARRELAKRGVIVRDELGRRQMAAIEVDRLTIALPACRRPRASAWPSGSSAGSPIDRPRSSPSDSSEAERGETRSDGITDLDAIAARIAARS